MVLFLLKFREQLGFVCKCKSKSKSKRKSGALVSSYYRFSCIITYDAGMVTIMSMFDKEANGWRALTANQAYFLAGTGATLLQPLQF